MTGRIFTCDHRVYDLPELLSWEVVHTGTVPCDSYSVTFLYDRSMAEALKLAAGFAAINRGMTMLRAIVDEYTVELGSGGLPELPLPAHTFSCGYGSCLFPFL